MTGYLKKTYTRFLKIRGNPHEIALGFALGLFIGMSPTIGLHTAIAVFFAALFKWNKISAALAVWISNPFTAPVVYGITYYTGSKLLGINGDFVQNGVSGFSTIIKTISKAPEIFWALTVGGVIIGLPLAFVGYYLAFSAVGRYQEDIKRKLAQQKEKRARKKKSRVKKRRKK
jgi:uncharacterized protein